MKTFNQLSVVACAAFVMFLSASPVAAQQGQGRGNFEEFRQRMMDNYRERLEIKGLYLEDGLRRAAEQAEVPVRINRAVVMPCKK